MEKRLGLTFDELPDVLTAKDIAEYLQSSTRQVYNWFAQEPESGGIKNFRKGKMCRAFKDDFAVWLGREPTRKGVGMSRNQKENAPAGPGRPASAQ